MSPRPADRTTRILFAVSGLALFGYLALRPWAGGDTPAAWSSIMWPVSHLLAVTGFVAYAALGARRAGRAGGILASVTVALLLPYYGAEAYALQVLGSLDPAQAQAVAQAFRYGPIPITMFGLGWVALGTLAVLTARTVRTPGLASRLALIVHTVAMVAWVPVFFLSPVGRIAHATVILISAVVLATRGYAVPRPAAEPQLTVQPTR
ncbi:hypothetical protein AADG42_12295 [Ammonicoccus fulvus]|uniref:Tryptophan-rich sensory protein n=1 Tax=Ammonicoccus fulvus TaxID=3138240 RepID=A0ABZ3FPS3_9ACTN